MELTKKDKFFWRLSIVLSPVSILSVLYLIAVFTFGNMFNQSFYVTNESEKEIKITPFTNYKNSDYFKINLQKWTYPPFSKIKQANISISPKQTQKFIFDSDGGYLKGFVIKTENLNKVLYIDHKGDNAIYSINNIDALQDVDIDFDKKITGKTYEYLFYLVLIIGLINIYIHLKARAKRRLKKRDPIKT
ncbi:MAG: hypothetical protein JXL97_07125 [Bacteroidales bacterium]|nr:hypothetical protein [Bacteroidales bacterium]